MEPIQFLDGISGYVRTSTTNSADKPIKIAVIDPAYDAFDPPYPASIPLPRVTFEGETTLSGKTYPVASGYIPSPGARVYMVPIGTTYLIAGAVTGYAAQGFYANPGTTAVGVEFGEGSYFDTDSGLVLQTDADIAGDLSVSGIGNYLHKRRTTDGTSVVNSVVLVNDAVLFLDLDVGVWEVHAHLAYTGVGGDFKSNWAFSGTWNGLKYCIGGSPYNAATTTINDANNRDASPGRFSVHQPGSSVGYSANDSSNFQGCLEFGSMNVTVAGRWTIQHAQNVSNAAQALLRTGSFITARRVG